MEPTTLLEVSQSEEAAARKLAEVTELARRESVSEPIALTPSVQSKKYYRLQENPFPEVTFLDTRVEVVNQPELERLDVASKMPRTSSLPSHTTAATTFRPRSFSSTTVQRLDETDSEVQRISIHLPFALNSDSDIQQLTDARSSRKLGSTLAEALNPPAQYLSPEDRDHSSTITPVKLPVEHKIHPLGGRSRARIKEYIAGNEPFNLPQGHPFAGIEPFNLPKGHPHCFH